MPNRSSACISVHLRLCWCRVSCSLILGPLSCPVKDRAQPSLQTQSTSLPNPAFPAMIPPMSTSQPELPLILLTNDDGIASPGLRAAVEAVLPLGKILVVAPTRQWSGAGRSMPYTPEPHTSRCPFEVGGQEVLAYQVEASPALTVARAVLGLAQRRPALLISGINYGENIGAGITSSGTIGAALQGAAFGIPSLAVSLQTPKEMHYNPSASVDFSAAGHFTHLFAQMLLRVALPFDVDILKVDVPDDATVDTPWRLTSVSRQTYFVATSLGRADPAAPTAPAPVERPQGTLDYRVLDHPERTEPDSDIYALAVDRVVSVAPLSLDLTSRTDPAKLESLLRDRSLTQSRGEAETRREKELEAEEGEESLV
jgi:5'-nucleotidase